MHQPEDPGSVHVFNHETKSLRDTQQMLSAVDIQDAYSYVEEHSHPRLWISLANHALDTLDLSYAEKVHPNAEFVLSKDLRLELSKTMIRVSAIESTGHKRIGWICLHYRWDLKENIWHFGLSLLQAFVRCQNYYGVRFVKGLHTLKNKSTQKAEVCLVFPTLSNNRCDLRKSCFAAILSILYCEKSKPSMYCLSTTILCAPERQLWKLHGRFVSTSRGTKKRSKSTTAWIEKTLLLICAWSSATGLCKAHPSIHRLPCWIHLAQLWQKRPLLQLRTSFYVDYHYINETIGYSFPNWKYSQIGWRSCWKERMVVTLCWSWHGTTSETTMQTGRIGRKLQSTTIKPTTARNWRIACMHWATGMLWEPCWSLFLVVPLSIPPWLRSSPTWASASTL